MNMLKIMLLLLAPSILMGNSESLNTKNPKPYELNKSIFLHWLPMGINLYNASQFYDPKEKYLAKNIANLPTMQQLTQCANEIEFGKIQGYQCSYSLVKFINRKWGWGKIMELKTNYDAMRSILGISEEELRLQWIDYLKKEYNQ